MEDGRRDLFDDLTRELGCAFMSDMHYPPWHGAAQSEMARMNLHLYSLDQLEDMADYLYGECVVFESCERAEAYFEEKARGKGWSLWRRKNG